MTPFLPYPHPQHPVRISALSSDRLDCLSQPWTVWLQASVASLQPGGLPEDRGRGSEGLAEQSWPAGGRGMDKVTLIVEPSMERAVLTSGKALTLLFLIHRALHEHLSLLRGLNLTISTTFPTGAFNCYHQSQIPHAHDLIFPKPFAYAISYGIGRAGFINPTRQMRKVSP